MLLSRRSDSRRRRPPPKCTLRGNDRGQCCEPGPETDGRPPCREPDPPTERDEHRHSRPHGCVRFIRLNGTASEGSSSAGAPSVVCFDGALAIGRAVAVAKVAELADGVPTADSQYHSLRWTVYRSRQSADRRGRRQSVPILDVSQARLRRVDPRDGPSTSHGRVRLFVTGPEPVCGFWSLCATVDTL